MSGGGGGGSPCHMPSLRNVNLTSICRYNMHMSPVISFLNCQVTSHYNIKP